VAIIFSIHNAPEMKADITSNYRSAIMDNEDIVMVYVFHFALSLPDCFSEFFYLYPQRMVL
jgi:hypothetical protein